MKVTTGFKNRNTMRLLAERDGLDCCLCGAPVDLSIFGQSPIAPTLEHIIPQSRGGTNRLFNLALSHLACNQARGVKKIAREQTVPACQAIQCNWCAEPFLTVEAMDAHRFEAHGFLSARWQIRAPQIDPVAFEIELNRSLRARKIIRQARSRSAHQGVSTSWARRSEQARKVMGV